MKPTLALCTFLATLCMAAGTLAQSGQQSTTPTGPSSGTGKVGGQTSGAGIPAQGAQRPQGQDVPGARAPQGAQGAQAQGSQGAQPGQGDKAGRPAAALPDAPSPGVRDPAGMAEVDREFMRQAAHNGLAEIEASTLAQQKARRGDVKAFAGKMVQDHTKTNEELKRLASAKNLALPVRPAMPQRSTLSTLRASEGEKFDHAYAEHFGVKAHEDNVDLFKDAAEKARDADVKAFAQKTLASLQEHLAMAKALQESLKPTAAGRREQQGRTVSTEKSSATDASATPKSGN
jgi:putative membrane protein